MSTIIKFSVFVLVLFLLTNCEKTEVDKSFNEGVMYMNAFTSSSGMNMGEIGSSEKYKEYEENPFIEVSEEPVSTFSVDADGGSYSNMRRFLYQGQNPPTASVRIEEYINYFTFDYPEPDGNENVSVTSEVATCPWAEGHHLIRLGIKGKAIPENQVPNSNFVFLIDVSGSMNSSDKLGILKAGFSTMVDNIRDKDKIAIVTYAGSAGILLESTYGDEKDKIKSAIEELGAGGSTAGAEGIVTAYEIAKQNFILDGNNRVILGTDGDFNVGASSTEELVEFIEKKRESGIYLTVLGVGGGNLNDHMMEQIANKGNGNYEYIDNAEQIQKVFVHEKAKFYTVAKDSKIQVTFNPRRVHSYRLIGYENRSLNAEDFDDDTKDAGEIGATQTISAFYEVVLSGNSSSEKFAQFSFRYKKPNNPKSQLLTHNVKSVPKDIFQSSENMRFIASVTGFGLLMKQSEYKGSVSKEMVLGLGQNAVGFDPNGYRKEFLDLLENWNE